MQHALLLQQQFRQYVIYIFTLHESTYSTTIKMKSTQKRSPNQSTPFYKKDTRALWRLPRYKRSKRPRARSSKHTGEVFFCDQDAPNSRSDMCVPECRYCGNTRDSFPKCGKSPYPFDARPSVKQCNNPKVDF